MKFPIARDARGEAVRDLQHRLATLGYEPGEAGIFGDGLEAAVRAFQAARGLRVDGICGRQTWSSLVEAGYQLGDRLLYHRTPLLRGDDVVDLQHRLNALGFHAGREDGFFGANTLSALVEFQRNAGLQVDGICGPASVAALERLSRFAGGSVAAVRERESLRAGCRSLTGRRIYVAVELGLDGLGEFVDKGLGDTGAEVVVAGGGEDDSVAAAEANLFGAEFFLGLRFGDLPGCSCDYWEYKSFRSETGLHLAHCVLAELSTALGCPLQEPRGRAYAVLRETRMPAVVCQPVQGGDVDGVRHLVARAGDAGRAIVRGLRRAIETPYQH